MNCDAAIQEHARLLWQEVECWRMFGIPVEIHQDEVIIGASTAPPINYLKKVFHDIPKFVLPSSDQATPWFRRYGPRQAAPYRKQRR